MGNAAQPTNIFSREGDTWNLRSLSSVRIMDLKFRMGEEFEETTTDGKKLKV